MNISNGPDIRTAWDLLNKPFKDFQIRMLIHDFFYGWMLGEMSEPFDRVFMEIISISQLF